MEHSADHFADIKSVDSIWNLDNFHLSSCVRSHSSQCKFNL